MWAPITFQGVFLNVCVSNLIVSSFLCFHHTPTQGLYQYGLPNSIIIMQSHVIHVMLCG